MTEIGARLRPTRREEIILTNVSKQKLEHLSFLNVFGLGEFIAVCERN